MGSLAPTPAYGQRLLPAEIDKIARERPDRVLFYLPRNNKPSDGYEEISAARFANAVNRTCWWLKSELGQKPRTFAYIGQNDFRYLLIVVAAAKTGNKVLLSSPRNSVAGHLSLIEQAGCEVWFTTTGVGKFDFVKLPIVKVPEVNELIDKKTVKAHPYDRQWPRDRKDPFVTLHSTGSTGMPRVIQLTMDHAASGDALASVDRIEGKLPTLAEWAGTKMLNGMPQFHIAGLCFSLLCTVFFEWSVVFPPAGPVMQNVIADTIDNIKIDSAFVSPLVLIDIAQNPAVLDKLATLKFVSSAGGPVPVPVGNIINPRVPILQTIGMTEGMVVPDVTSHPEEWAYFHFHPCSGFEMRPFSDTLYELIFIKKKELAHLQAIFMTFPNQDIYETKDLFSRHPKYPYLYKYETRKDDLVVLAHGEKFNPVAAEFQLAHHPWLSLVYIAGRNKVQTSVLLNPAEDRLESSDDEIIEAVWPSIEAVNKVIPAFAQIHRGFVKVLRTPMPRTPKGTVARYEVERVFRDEIDAIYQDSDSARLASSEPTASIEIDASSEETVRAGLRKAISLVSPGIELDEIKDDDSLLGQGVDSLQVIRLARLLSTAFPSSPIQVEVGTIYANATLEKLGQVLWEQVQEAQKGRQGTITADVLRAQAVSETLAKHLPSFTLSRTAKEHVVLTGTTGIVGSYLLDALCKNDRVAKVWCLNRSSTAEATYKQAELAKARGLSPNWQGKARFVQIDLAAENLDLSWSDMKEIREQATTIIHNAWEVNFNLPLSSFEPQLAGLQSLVKICADTRHTIRFFFVSSISSATNYPSQLLGPVPEAKLSNLDASVNGYGASKLVAEHLLSAAAQSGVLRLSVLRVGQVAGPVATNGQGSMWTRRDWVPAIVDASAYLGKLPADLGAATALDWIPIDLLAEVIGQLVVPNTNKNELETFYNLVNPRTASWQSLLPTLKARLEISSSKKVQIVPFAQWLDELEKSENSVIKEVEKMNGTTTPAQTAAHRAQTGLKLLSFFRVLAEVGPLNDDTVKAILSTPNWKVDNALKHSAAFAELPPVSSAWLETWLKQWGY